MKVADMINVAIITYEGKVRGNNSVIYLGTNTLERLLVGLGRNSGWLFSRTEGGRKEYAGRPVYVVDADEYLAIGPEPEGEKGMGGS